MKPPGIFARRKLHAQTSVYCESTGALWPNDDSPFSLTRVGESYLDDYEIVLTYSDVLYRVFQH